MKIISKANESVLAILKPFSMNSECSRWSHFCVHNHISDGVLVFNSLTRELILLNYEDYNRYLSLDYLKKHFFIVSEKTDEIEVADFVRQMLSNRQLKLDKITNYTIFTTTDCNARCFYCFELGNSRINMDCTTAEKVVQYIKAHCGTAKVRIGWFGGEPLLNVDAIDTITNGLRKEGIKFVSHMVSNGYLFNDTIIKRANELWNLEKVQITLDGTQEVYNKIKSYIYRDSNPFEVVLNNIAQLQETNIRVVIRLNMDLYNADDLLILAQELGQRFSGRKGISVYAHHLFKNGTPDAELYSDEEWQMRNTALERLNAALGEHGLLPTFGISKNIRLNHCMADSGNSVTILPDGNIGLCEHHTESEYVSHVDRTDFDDRAVASWKVRAPRIPECAECFYYPDCIKLEKCSSDSVCYKQFRQEKLKSIKRAMLSEYESWLKKVNTNDDKFSDIC